MPHWLMVLGGIGVMGLGAWGIQFLWHRDELKQVNRRESLEMRDLYARYYAALGLSEASVLEIWKEIATTLKLPPEKLRPTDRFGHDVGTYLVTSDELDTLTELGAKRARQLGIVVELERITTVDDYIRALAERK